MAIRSIQAITNRKERRPHSWDATLNEALAKLAGPDDAIAASHTIGRFRSLHISEGNDGGLTAVILYEPFVVPAMQGAS